MADDSVIESDLYTPPLAGTVTLARFSLKNPTPLALLVAAFLRGSELTAQMNSHGKVTLKKLPPRRRKRT